MGWVTEFILYASFPTKVKKLEHEIIKEAKLNILSILLSAFVKVGGYEKLIEDYFEARASNRSYVDPSNETMGSFCDNSKSSDCCGEVKEHSMHLFRSMYPGDSDLPWTGIRKYH